MRKYLILSVLIIASFVVLNAQSPEEENDKPYLDFWNNWLTPAEYSQQLDYVQNQMKDEFAAERKLKARRNEILAAQMWKSVGPRAVRTLNGDHTINPNIVFHGRVRAFQWYNNPTTGWETYIGASSGGLWAGKLTIFGREWTSLGNNLPNPSVGALAIKPGDPKTIFVGTGDFLRFTGSGLYKTTNRGASWDKIRLIAGAAEATPGSVTDLFYDPTDQAIMWLSSDVGVFKSIDSGATWSRSPVDPSQPWWAVHDLVIDPSDHDRLYVAFAFARDGYGKMIWKTTNGGASWAPSNFGLPYDDLGVSIALDISPSNPAILYAALTNTKNELKGIYKTTNRGALWDLTSSQPYDYMYRQGATKNVIRVHPTNPDIVYAGSIGFIKTTNGGASWTIPARGHDDQTVIEFTPGDPSMMTVAGDGGIFRYRDAYNDVYNGDEMFFPQAMIQSYSLDYAVSETNVMISGTQDNGTLVTLSGGTGGGEWTMFSGCDGGNEVAIDPRYSSNFFFNSWCGPSPRLRSLDKGGSITNINSGLPDTIYYSPIGQGKGNPDYLFTVNTEALYYSNDQGNSWLRATTEDYDFVPGSRNVRGLAVGGTGSNMAVYTWHWGWPWLIQVFEGTPGSMTSTYRNLPVNRYVGQGNFANSGIRVDPWNPYTAYAFEANSPFRIYKTTNAGANWIDITGTDVGGVLPSARKYDIVSSKTNSNVMYAGTDFGVFKTTNNGATWYGFMWGLPIVPVTSLAYIEGTAGDPDMLRIGTFGRGYWQRALSGDDPPPIYTIGFPVHGMDFLGGHGISVGVDGRVAHTSDDGKSWLEGSSSTGSMLNSSRLLDSLTGVAVGASGSIVRTTDGGDSWASVPPPVLSSFFDLSFPDPTHGFAVGDAGTIIHSTDGGQSWQTVMTGTNARLHSVFFTDPLNGWISGTDNSGQIPMVLLLHTTDGGMNWSPFQNGVGPGGGCDVMFPDPLTGYLTIDGGIMLKTTDGGQSWNQLQTGTQQSLHDVFFTDPNNGWACGDGGVFIHTTDGGQQWTTEESGTDSNLYRLSRSNDRLFTGGDEGVLSKSTETLAEVVHNLTADWNMLSVPVGLPEYSLASVFPSASSSAFTYQGNYVNTNILQPGNGFWLKFDNDQSFAFTGQPITTLAVPVFARWNMVGSLTLPVDVNSITSTPQNIVQSPYFGYNGGYYPANMLEPGEAYWVRTSQDGQLMFNAFATRTRSIITNPVSSVDGWGSISFTDARGHQQRLYFSSSPLPAEVSRRCELPPRPPDGMFDIRFATGRWVESPDIRENRIIPITLSSAVYPLQVAWKSMNNSNNISLHIGSSIVALRGEGKMQLTDATETLALILLKTRGDELPRTFGLDQNYPNPFNPSTVISYQLPVSSHVTLKVYNVLGEEVATLVDKMLEAGYQSAQWDASRVSSGVYYYRLETHAFTQVRKMLLVK